MGRNNQNSGKAYGKDLATHLANVAPAGFDSVAGENENSALFQAQNETSEPLPEPDPVFEAGTDNATEEDTTNTDNYDLITSDSDNDTIVVEGSTDTVIESNDGDDYLLGGDGNDILYGGAGYDYLWGGYGDDTLYGGTENDTLLGCDGNDVLYGEDGNDILKGNLHNDILYGGAGDDTLYGGAGNDILDGGLGNDILHGGSGADTLTGRGGADTFYFIAADGTDAVDTITDFNTGMDSIDISDLLSAYDPLADAIEDFVQITDDGTQSVLAVDIDGGGDKFVEIATIQNVTGITNEQLLVDSGALVVA